MPLLLASTTNPVVVFTCCLVEVELFSSPVAACMKTVPLPGGKLMLPMLADL